MRSKTRGSLAVSHDEDRSFPRMMTDRGEARMFVLCSGRGGGGLVVNVVNVGDGEVEMGIGR